jgi:hypothetical protein
MVSAPGWCRAGYIRRPGLPGKLRPDFSTPPPPTILSCAAQQEEREGLLWFWWRSGVAACGQGSPRPLVRLAWGQQEAQQFGSWTGAGRWGLAREEREGIRRAAGVGAGGDGLGRGARIPSSRRRAWHDIAGGRRAAQGQR